MTGRLEIAITERLSSQGELFIRKKLALMFNNSNNSKSRLSSLVKKQTLQRKNFFNFMGKLHNHESKSKPNRRGKGEARRAPPIDVKSKAELLPQLG